MIQDDELITLGYHYFNRSIAGEEISEWHVQAAIAATYAKAKSTEAIDWPAILGHYDQLLNMTASPVVALNRAVVMVKVHGAEPALAAEEIYGIYDSSPARPYDMKEILARVLDGSRFDEYKAEYGKTLICGYGRIGGFAVGIVANQKLHAHQTDHEGHKRVEFGGVIYTESAEKAARFIMDCNQNLIPLIFFHDVNGFMVGRDAEWSGIIKAGAKMVNAVSNSVVPKITVIVGGSFGAGHYAMCGKAYDPRFVFAWPTARYAVMSGDSAAGTLVEIKIKQLEREGKKLSDAEKKELHESIRKTYESQTDPRYAAARLWVDAIIDPAHTREALIEALEAASLNPVVAELKTGVLQT